MKLETRCIPLGTLPYETIESATRSLAKLYGSTPYLPVLTKLDSKDSVQRRTLENIPGVTVSENGSVILRRGREYEEGLMRLEDTFKHPTMENLEEFGFSTPFMEKYLLTIKKFKSPHAFINLLGPFTLSQILMNSIDTQTITDKSYRKLFIESICVKAMWLIYHISTHCANTIPVIILEEPILNKLGDIKRKNESITADAVTNLIAKVVTELKSTGCYVGVQCLEKCDWQVPIKAGVDFISFDAYNNPNNLNIIPDVITDFISSGGKINWGIVPTMSESIVRSLNIEYLKKRLFTTMDGLAMAGVPYKHVYNSALVSVQGDMDKLPLIFAEKAMLLCNQLSKSIPVMT